MALLSNPLPRIAEWIARHRFTPRPPTKIVPFAGGIEFRIGQDGETTRVLWADVDSVVFEKADLFTVDTILCYLTFRAGTELKTILFDEEDEGLYEATSAFEKILAGFDQNWFGKVAFPAFKLCRHQAFPYSELDLGA